MLTRIPGRMLRSRHGQGVMEYVLIAIVIGLIVLFVAARFGGTVLQRFEEADETVESTKVSETDDTDTKQGGE